MTGIQSIYPGTATPPGYLKDSICGTFQG